MMRKPLVFAAASSMLLGVCVQLSVCAHISGVEPVRPVSLRCEDLKNPLGIDVLKPRLSWLAATEQRGWQQAAYQILVASGEHVLQQNRGDLWDSGKVQSDQSIQVEYAGKALGYRMRCFWRVRVWSAEGEVSAWGEPAQWSMGPLKAEDWTAKWITMQAPGGLAHPWLRRTFELTADVKRAEVHVNTPSHYELYINGRKVGDEVLVPAHANLKKRFLYNSYEVSSYLSKGTNCIALWMGPGWYQPCYGNPYNAPVLRLQLDVQSAEGLRTIGTDGQWRVADSCISQIGPWAWANMGGERWDAAKYIEDWNQVTFDERGWASALEVPASRISQIVILPDALPKPRVTASSCTPGYEPKLAADGAASTRWVSAGNGPGMGPTSEKPQYLQLDHDQARPVAALYLKPGEHCGPKELEIQCSDEGKDYRTIHRETVPQNQELVAAFDEVRSAHFRIVFPAAYPFQGDRSWNVQVFETALLSREEAKSILQQTQASWQGIPGSRLGSPVSPAKVYEYKGKWVIDFGVTVTGWMRLRLAELKPGQQITIDYADLAPENRALMHMPNQDGFQTFNQADMYVAGTRAQDMFCSKFNQHAFRYAVIGGLSKAPQAQDAEAMNIMTDLEPAGDFSCSNELFNEIHRVTVRTSRTQAPCGVLGGGEAREKLGYGDGGSFLSGFLYNLRSDAFLNKWLRDWCDGQQADGFLGHTAPEFYPAGGGPSWGGEADELVQRLYLYYGDGRAVAYAYKTLKRYIDHLESHTEGDILRYFNPYQPGEYVEWYFLDDWNPPGTGPNVHQFVFGSVVQREFFNNCYRVLLWDHLASYAEVLGDKAEAKRCRDRLAVLRPLIHQTYYDPANKTYKANRQAYLTIALLAGIMPSELRPAIFRQLEDDIVITKKGHLDVGLQGSFMLLDLLAKENRNDLVALMMNQVTFPGWGFLIKERKVTTWPESWSGWGSQVIQVVGTCGAWFYEGLAGIRPDPAGPGFKKIIIKPAMVGDLTWVKCSYNSPYGRVVSNWKREGGRGEMEVTIPPNTTATVYVPAGDQARITESGKDVTECRTARLLRKGDGCFVYEMSAGHYELSAETGPPR